MSSKSFSIAVYDYGSGNLHSVRRALEYVQARVYVGNDKRSLEAADGLVVPGVGAFSACMQQLHDAHADEFIRTWIAQGGKFLGICVGHQILFENGYEHGITSKGLGIYPGDVEILRSNQLPHMGWNHVHWDGGTPFEGIADERFYFVHSYGVHTAVESAQVGWTCHEGDKFVSAVRKDNVMSTQFHPEKSGVAGLRLLKNWILS